MLGNLINIKKFNWNPVVLKIFLLTSKNYYFSAQLVQNWGPHGPRPKEKTTFFSKITKQNPKLSKTFYLNKIPYVF